MAGAGGGLATIVRPVFGEAPAHRPAPVTLSIVPPPLPAVPKGRPRSIGVSMILFLVTSGIYGGIWTYLVHRELRRETARGIGGFAAVVLYLLAPPLLAFTLPAEVARARHHDALECAVSGRTGLWVLIPVAGWFVWFVSVQRALNEYWWDR